MSNAYRQKMHNVFKLIIQANDNFDNYHEERIKSPLHQISSDINYNYNNNLISPKSYNSMNKKDSKDINQINTLQYVDIQTMKKKKKEK